jgi:hypothetical protein
MLASHETTANFRLAHSFGLTDTCEKACECACCGMICFAWVVQREPNMLTRCQWELTVIMAHTYNWKEVETKELHVKRLQAERRDLSYIHEALPWASQSNASHAVWMPCFKIGGTERCSSVQRARKESYPNWCCPVVTPRNAIQGVFPSHYSPGL